MKKRLYTIGIIIYSVCMLLSSCVSKMDEEMGGVFPYFRLEQLDYNVHKDGDSLLLPIETNRPLKASSSSNWFTFDYGKDGKSVTIIVDKNTNESGRTAKITVYSVDGLFSEEITIVQNESGVHTYKGNVSITSDKELYDFTQKYNRIDGNLIIGNSAQNTSSQTITKAFAQTKAKATKSTKSSDTDLTSISDLDSISEITGNIQIINTDKLSDISILKKFTMVKELTLTNNTAINDISVIKDMNLTSLIVTHSEDFSKYQKTIETLTQLLTLDVTNNQIVDISFLSGLVELQTLILGSGKGETNEIYNLSPVFDLPNLIRLVLDGLRIPKEQIDEFRQNHPGCEVLYDSMRASTAIITSPEITDISDKSITLASTIKDPGYGDILSSGFYFGKSAEDMEKIEVAPDESSVLNLTRSGLTQSTSYYFCSYVENEAGLAISDTISKHTYGLAILDPSADSYTPDEKQISFAGALEYHGGKVTEYGTLLGINKDLSVDRYTYIFKRTTDEDKPTYWNGTFDGLFSGNKYYLRHFATNEFGTVYSEVQEVITLGDPEIGIHMPVIKDRGTDFITISSTVLSPSLGEITESGFYFGTSPNSMEKKSCTYDQSNNEITLTCSDLNSSTVYYFSAYIEFDTGDKGQSDTVYNYTLGEPILNLGELSAKGYDGWITFEGELVYSGGVQTECGTLLGSTSDLSLDNYKEIYKTQVATEEGHSWSESFDNLYQGFRYYIRHYATNEYGTTYSEVTEVKTTGWISYNIDMPGTQQITVSSITITSGITWDIDIKDITEGGVYYGTSPSNMEKLEGKIDEDHVLTATMTGLDSSTRYNIVAYAEFYDDLTCYSDTLVTYTHGLPVLDTIHNITASEDYFWNTSYPHAFLRITGKILSTGDIDATIGTILGRNSDIDLSNCEHKHEETRASWEVPSEWEADINVSEPATRYYYRHFATNKYGTVYGDVYSVISAGTPNIHISRPKIVEATNTSISLSSTVVTDYVDITETYFYYGTDSLDMQRVDASFDNETFTLSHNFTNLTANTVYYFKAEVRYADDKSVLSAVQIICTYGGLPIFAEEYDIRVVNVGRFIHEYTLLSTGSGNTEYGSILGLTEDLDLINYKDICTYSSEAPAQNIKCVDEFDELHYGHRYYIRTYAKNEYGIVYGDVREVYTLGDPSDSKYPTHNVSFQFGDNPVYAERMNAIVLREDFYKKKYITYKTSSGNPKMFDNCSFKLPEGKQNLVLTTQNYGTSGEKSLSFTYDSYEYESERMFTYSMVENRGIVSEIVFKMWEDFHLTKDTSIYANPDRLTAKVKIQLSYVKNGVKQTNLSSLITRVTVRLDGISRTCYIDKNFKPHYEEETYLEYRDTEITNGNTEIVGIYNNVFPSATGADAVLTLEVTFKDGTSKEITTSREALEAGKSYNYQFLISDSDKEGTDGSFTLDEIIHNDENIEF